MNKLINDLITLWPDDITVRDRFIDYPSICEVMWQIKYVARKGKRGELLYGKICDCKEGYAWA